MPRSQRDTEKRRRVMQRSIKLGHCICDPKLSCPCPLLREKDVCLCAGEQLEMQAGPVKLTQLVEKTGCASKIDQATLHRVLGGIQMPADPRVLIGAPAGDDAGVFLHSPEKPSQAWVQTVDVFSPCVDDPYLFGQIAAANSVSDIYAMGGTPLTALSIIGFPARELPDAIMRDILRGGVDKMAEAGVSIIGGHSINDHEIKAGFAVTGLVDPQRIMSNAGARPGDVLVLTKPIGTGILSFAAQIGRAPAGALDAIAKSMATLNRAAAEAMQRFGAHACTDVTGFGLIGHLRAMAAASGVDVEIVFDDVPLFSGVWDCVAAGIVPGAVERNRESSQHAVCADNNVTPSMLDVLFDAQTSGGLLIVLPEAQAPKLIATLAASSVSPAIIGRVAQTGTGRVIVRSRQALQPTCENRPDSTADLAAPVVEETTMSDCCSGHGSEAPPCCSDAVSPGAASPGAVSCGEPVRPRAGSSLPPAASASPQPAPASSIQRKFQEFLQAANQPGALDVHTKQAIALALSVLAKCDPCVRAHIAKARAKGFTIEEIDEAAWLAISFGGAPLMMFYNAIRKEVLG